jgi:hypothetical protein
VILFSSPFYLKFFSEKFPELSFESML